MGNLLVAFGKTGTGFLEVRETRLIRGFTRPRIQPLHPDANAEKRNSARNGGADRSGHARRIETLGCRKMPHTGKHNPLRRLYQRQIPICHHRIRAQAALPLKSRRSVAAKCPTPGSTIRSADCINDKSESVTIGSAPRWRRALSTDVRFPAL